MTVVAQKRIITSETPDPAKAVADGVSRALRAGAERAVADSFSNGLAVIAYEAGQFVETAPTGERTVIADPDSWTPHHWKMRAAQ